MNTIKNIDNYTWLQVVKFSLAAIIIVMGAYGYMRFFSGGGSDEPVWLVMILFIVIEAAILFMTTMFFSSNVKQHNKISFGLVFAISMMWFISGIGIDQTIWGMMEAKYKTVRLHESSVIAEKETELLLKAKAQGLELEKNILYNDIKTINSEKLAKQKTYIRQERQLRDTIWYDGNRCDLSTDCTARKNVAENALSLTKDELDSYSLSKKLKQEKLILVEKELAATKFSIVSIVDKRVTFEKNNRVTLDNKKDEAIVHVLLQRVLNTFMTKKIETPERAYVILLSFIVYPVYILLIIFISSNSLEMIETRRKEQEEKAKQKIKNKKGSHKTYDALIAISKMLKKLVIYQIKTRRRKVITNEIEVEIEVIKEVEVEIYKDGKEIVEVKVDVPYFIEKEIVIEKVVEKLIIEKEFVTVPADVNLNLLNGLVKNGSSPADLSEVLKKINEERPLENEPDEVMKGSNNDKYRAA